MAQVAWSSDNSWFSQTWISRAATQSKTLVCLVDTLNCQISGREDGGVVGKWESGKWENSAIPKNQYSGWVGSFRPFQPILTNNFPEYFAIYSQGYTQHKTDIHIKNTFYSISNFEKSVLTYLKL